ncbi:MAG: hypothetical protein AB7E55_31520 [Pigmentiphaga sp.]
MRLALLAALLIVHATPAMSDPWQPSHSCRKPYKPFAFNSQWELDNFNDDVRRYRRCITDFVEEQETAIENHTNAIGDAIEDWNRFVRLELD